MSKVKITGKVLSIRIGRDATHIALIGNKGEVLHVAGYNTPVGAVEDGTIRDYGLLLGMLRPALKAPEFRHVRQAVFCLCTTQVITEVVTVPVLAEAKLEKLLMANVDMYFPVDMQDYHVVWQAIGSKQQENGQKEQQVQLWAVPKSVLTPYYTLANACGLSVAAVDYCGHSIATAVGATYANPAKPAKAGKKQVASVDSADGVASAPKTDLHITLERDLIGLTFVQNHQVMLQRIIPCGADPSYQFTEVAMIVEYYRSLEYGRGSQINALVSGALANSPKILDDLRAVTGLQLGWLSDSDAPHLLLCVGAAATNMDFGLSTMNSPSKARNQVSSHLWQYALVLVGGLMLTGVILISLGSKIAWNAEISNLQKAQQTLTIQAAQTNGFADNYADYERNYASYSADWETIFTSLKTYNDNLVLLIEELETVMPEKSSVVNLQIAADGMNVTFACETKEEAAYLIMALRELQYADLVGISNLSGGGKGPATSYGSGNSSVEAPPTEGSSTSATSAKLMEMISSEITEDELVSFAMNLTPEEFKLLEATYGKIPDADHGSLEELENNEEVTLTYEIRKKTLNTMFKTDPFADTTFAELLVEDFHRGKDAILWWDILEDVLRLENEGLLGSGTSGNIEAVWNQMDILVDVITKDEKTLASTEKLICTNEDLQKTYLHYLEVETGLRKPELFPYLDMEKVATHILTGGFQTGNADLDAKMNALISDETWSLIDKLNSEEELGALLNKYLQEGTTGIPLVDEFISNYINTGSTGYAPVDAKINSFIASGKLDELMMDMLNKYLTEGTTGSKVCDDMIKNYLLNGTTNNASLDAVIKKYINSGALDTLFADMLQKYLAEGTTGVEIVDTLLEKFLNTGSTGNAALDSVIKSYLESGAFVEKLEDMLTKYLVEGSTGNKLLDQLIKNYLDTGKTGNDLLDKLINSYIDELMKDLDEKKVAELVKKYLADKTTGNPLYDALLKKYFADGTTGIKKLDELIKKYQDSIIGGGTSDDLLDLLDKFFGNGSSTGNGNGTGTGQPVDTRIFFTATLMYNEELAMAELERKGLDYESKVEKLEVEE